MCFESTNFYFSKFLGFCYATINAMDNQRSLQSTPLVTAWFNHQIWGKYMCGAPERLPAFGASTFSTVITTSMVQDINEKSLALIVWCVDYMLRCIYRLQSLPFTTYNTFRYTTSGTSTPYSTVHSVQQCCRAGAASFGRRRSRHEMQLRLRLRRLRLRQ
jgi:hypothetical protein